MPFCAEGAKLRHIDYFKKSTRSWERCISIVGREYTCQCHITPQVMIIDGFVIRLFHMRVQVIDQNK